MRRRTSLAGEGEEEEEEGRAFLHTLLNLVKSASSRLGRPEGKTCLKHTTLQSAKTAFFFLQTTTDANYIIALLEFAVTPLVFFFWLRSL